MRFDMDAALEAGFGDKMHHCLRQLLNQSAKIRDDDSFLHKQAMKLMLDYYEDGAEFGFLRDGIIMIAAGHPTGADDWLRHVALPFVTPPSDQLKWGYRNGEEALGALCGLIAALRFASPITGLDLIKDILLTQIGPYSDKEDSDLPYPHDYSARNLYYPSTQGGAKVEPWLKEVKGRVKAYFSVRPREDRSTEEKNLIERLSAMQIVLGLLHQPIQTAEAECKAHYADTGDQLRFCSRVAETIILAAASKVVRQGSLSDFVGRAAS